MPSTCIGTPLPFNAARHADFQNLLKSYGNPEFFALKQRVVEAVGAGEAPSVVAVTDKRFARANVRVTLRQLVLSLMTVTAAPGATAPVLSVIRPSRLPR